MTTTSTQLVEAIAFTESEIKTLQGQQNSLNDKRHLLAALNGRLALASVPSDQDELKTRIATCLADIEQASAAREQLAIKQTSLKMLQSDLEYARGQERRQVCADILANYDRVRAGYEQASKDLLVTFRRLYELNREYATLTGRELLSDFDYRLELPAARNQQIHSPFSTGQEVRM